MFQRVFELQTSFDEQERFSLQLNLYRQAHLPSPSRCISSPGHSHASKHHLFFYTPRLKHMGTFFSSPLWGESLSLSPAFPSHGITCQSHWSMFEVFAKPHSLGGVITAVRHTHAFSLLQFLPGCGKQTLW